MTATTPGFRTGAPRRGMRWAWIAGGILVVIAALAASLLFAPPAFFFTALLKKAVHERTGRELSVESARYTLRQIVTVELSGVVLGRPGVRPGTSPLSARRVTARLPLRSLLDGDPQVLSVDIDTPLLNLVREASGTGNWQASPAPAIAVPAAAPSAFAIPPTTIRNGTLLYRDEGTASELRLDAIDATLATDAKYGGAAAKGRLVYNSEALAFDLAVSDAAAAAAGRTTPVALTIDSRILKARLAGDGAIGESPMLAGEIDASSPSAHELARWLGFGDGVPATLGALTLKARTEQSSATRTTGTIVLREAPVSYELALASLSDAIAGKPSRIKGKVAGRESGADLDADLDGTLHLGPQTRYAGALTARTGSIGTIAARLGIANPALKALGPGSLAATVDATPGRVGLADATFDADGRTGTFTGDIALAGPRPRITGSLALSRLDLDALLGRTPAAAPASAPESLPADDGFATTFDVLSAELDAIENPPPQFAPFVAGSAHEAAAAAPVWSTAPIDLKALRAADLDLDLSLTSVKFGQLPLSNVRLAAKLDNGELAATITQISIGSGSGSGAIALKARGAAHDAAIGLKLVNVDAEPISAELSGRPLLKGPSTVDLATRATGRSLAELVSTLDGSARIDMQKGQLRGWDIGAMVAELWNYKGWGYTPARSTPVDRLTASYTIKAGTVRSSPDLTMRGPTAGLRSVGSVVVPRRLIDQTVDVQNLFFNIVIKGDWTQKLWIGPAFLAGLQPAPGAAPEAASAALPPLDQRPAALPGDLTARIERILSDPTASGRLTAAQKAFLAAIVKGGGSGS